ncbi:MAG: TlpA family protein disulfide reductase [Acidobacteriota bacterium]|nr:TlpA family protein disulfide reductase [Acidobacteriota bacterium]
MKSDRIVQAALTAMVGLFCFALYSSLHETVVNAGDKAPNFSITTDSGKTVTARDFGGKLLLLNFWATWCPPCVEEIPGLNEMARQLGPNGLVILGVSVDKDESAYKQFLQKSPLSYLTARDPEEKINLNYGTIQYPESYLIDRNGRVIEKYISSQAWASPQMLEHVKSLL